MTEPISTPQSNKKSEQGVVNVMLAERISRNRSTIPLNVTPRTFTEIQAKLAKVTQAVETVSKVLHMWYSLSKDTLRARAFINLVSTK